MFTFANFFPASTIEEAYAELMKNRKNVLLGGTSYLRMGNTNYNTAVDISNVTDIDKITEKEDSFEIGAMVSFRQLETDKNLYQWFPVISTAVSDIVGVQLRNMVSLTLSLLFFLLTHMLCFTKAEN